MSSDEPQTISDIAVDTENLYREETFTDLNGSGEWDPGEPYEDRSGDGVHGPWFPHHLQGIVLVNGTFAFRRR